MYLTLTGRAQRKERQALRLWCCAKAPSQQSGAEQSKGWRWPLLANCPAPAISDNRRRGDFGRSIGRIDDMGTRIDGLERSIGELDGSCVATLLTVYLLRRLEWKITLNVQW